MGRTLKSIYGIIGISILGGMIGGYILGNKYPIENMNREIPKKIHYSTEGNKRAKPIPKRTISLERIVQKEPLVKPYLPIIQEKVKKYKTIFDVDPLLIIALIKAESNFNRNAISKVGAGGICQIMPDTAKAAGMKVFLPKYFKEARSAKLSINKFKQRFIKELRKIRKGTYIIRRGDTFLSIARKKRKKLKDLISANPHIKNPSRIKAGTVIIIPQEKMRKIKEARNNYLKMIQSYTRGFRRYKRELKSLIKNKSTKQLKNIDERFVPEIAIDFCVKHMAELLAARKGNIREAVSAYNAGLSAVIRYRGIPPYKETQQYQRRILQYVKEYKKFLKK